MTTATVKSDVWFLRLRSTPELIPTNILGAIRNGSVVDVLEVHSSGLWAKVQVNGEDDLFALKDTPHTGWVVTSLLELAPPPKPADEPPLLGIHVIGDHKALEDVVARGCRFTVSMHDKLHTIQMARQYPNCRFVYRFWFQSNPSVEDTIRALAPWREDPPLIFVGRNENDEGIGCDPEGIRIRAEYDIAVAKRIKEEQPNALYLAGSFAMGTPDYTNPDVCAAIRRYYAPAYNSGLLGWDSHNYIPKTNWRTSGLSRWYLTRYRFLFDRCGFDPRVRNVWSTEGGTDEPGVGGWKSQGLTPEQYLDCIAWEMEELSAPHVLDALSGNPGTWATPFRGMALFMAGDDAKWSAGFDVRSILPELQQRYFK